MLIGVTGQIGAGKSVVANALMQKGAILVEADAVGKQVTGSAPVLAKLAELWGESVRTKSGKLRPAKVAEIVFGDPTGRNLEIFNEIIRDPLGEAIWRELRKAKKLADRKSAPAPVVLDAALLPAWEIAQDMNLVILVTATKDTRLKRLLARGLGEGDALARMRSQSPLRVYRDIADETLTNNGSVEALNAKVDRLWRTRILPHL